MDPPLKIPPCFTQSPPPSDVKMSLPLLTRTQHIDSQHIDQCHTAPNKLHYYDK